MLLVLLPPACLVLCIWSCQRAAVQQVTEGPCTAMSPSQYKQFWVELNGDVITVGSGRRGSGPVHRWQDSQPLPALNYVGLAAWDKYNSFRNISVHPCITPSLRLSTELVQPSPRLLMLARFVLTAFHSLDSQLMLAQVATVRSDNRPSLTELCAETVLDNLCPNSICSCLLLIGSLGSAMEQLHLQLLNFLAHNLVSVVTVDTAGFTTLPCSTIQQLLLCPALVSSTDKPTI